MELISNDIDQSYNCLIRNGFKLNEHFYNCSGVNGVELGVPRPYLGGYFLTVGLVLLVSFGNKTGRDTVSLGYRSRTSGFWPI
ncbi:hypothetical protein CAEBREN_11419 [Caenorhabditis brenneri]|uniref:Uncharacterized protein n=1 Tax=Caenorhabditis brenneri TaxID=135651 RepID=G0P5T2_CAEBE|nr:hypothetical protein CAEBREN_11419 [Caenorhabditis brenneri]